MVVLLEAAVTGMVGEGATAAGSLPATFVLPAAISTVHALRATAAEGATDVGAAAEEDVPAELLLLLLAVGGRVAPAIHGMCRRELCANHAAMRV